MALMQSTATLARRLSGVRKEVAVIITPYTAHHPNKNHLKPSRYATLSYPQQLLYKKRPTMRVLASQNTLTKQ
jgi:hypothetical protein